MFTRYQVELTLIRDMLGTNPCDPHVMDKHIINRQRNLILEKSEINATVNKYLGAMPIAAEKGDAEVDAIVAKIKEITGLDLTPEEKALAIAGKLDSLKETFKSLELTGTTVFFWNQEKNLPMIGDHMIYGFLKAAGEAVSRTLPTKKEVVLHSSAFTSKIVNQHVRCEDQFITFDQDVRRSEDGHALFLQRSLRAMTAQGPRIALAKSEVVPAGAKLRFVLNVMDGSPMEEQHLRKLFSYGQIVGLGQWRNAGYGMFRYELQKVK